MEDQIEFMQTLSEAELRNLRRDRKKRAEERQVPPPAYEKIEGHQPGIKPPQVKLKADIAAINKHRATIEAAKRAAPRPGLISRIASKVAGTPSTPIRATS